MNDGYHRLVALIWQVIQSKKRSYQDNIESDESGDAEDLDNGYNGKSKFSH